jgi:hypothetical protein
MISHTVWCVCNAFQPSASGILIALRWVGGKIMKSNYLGKKIGGIILGLSLLVGIGIASSTTAQAQYPSDYWRQRQIQREQLRREQLRRQRQLEREQRRQGRVYVNPSYGYGYGYGVSADGRQTALNAGYNEGIKEGRRDRSRGDRFGYSDEGDFQRALADYNSRYGSQSQYQQYFRQGFANGYRDGYNGY